jgi:hypothetical protein
VYTAVWKSLREKRSQIIKAVSLDNLEEIKKKKKVKKTA